MDKFRKALYNLNPLVLSSIGVPCTVAQIVLSFFISNQEGIEALRYTGYGLWTLSAIFGIWPIITFRSKGGVPEGQSYMKTTAVVDSGLYAVVRHPQYLAGILINLAMILLVQHWLVTVLGIIPMLLTCLDAIKADQYCIEKFGEGYERYMERVPRLNVLLGIARLILSGRGARQ